MSWSRPKVRNLMQKSTSQCSDNFQPGEGPSSRASMSLGREEDIELHPLIPLASGSSSSCSSPRSSRELELPRQERHTTSLGRHGQDPLAISRSQKQRQLSSKKSRQSRSILNSTTESAKGYKVARLLKKLAVESEPGLTRRQLMLINHDLKPVEPARRQWGAWNFVGFWIADSFNIGTWMISSSMITSGLSWWQSWICVWLGYSIAAVFVCLTGRIGAKYHIGFPVVARSSFGIWGALWPVFNRAVMACIWYGVQGWIGGQCVYLMIRAIWNSYVSIST